MDLHERWDHARQRTEILRMRLQDLQTFAATDVPYVFLAESAVNQGDTVVRTGHVVVERPSIILPGYTPHFQGFEFEEALGVSEATLTNFLLIRGMQFPSLKYTNQHGSLKVFEGRLERAITHYQERLARAEDTKTGLVIGPEDAWQLSLLLLVGALVVRSAEGDLRRILEAWRKRQKEDCE